MAWPDYPNGDCTADGCTREASLVSVEAAKHPETYEWDARCLTCWMTLLNGEVDG